MTSSWVYSSRYHFARGDCGMKQSPHQNLRSLFDTSITVNHISEPLNTCHIEDHVQHAKRVMEKFNFDCLGVEENGKIAGYVVYEELKDGPVRSYVRSFCTGEIVSEHTSLIYTLNLFREHKRIFVLEENRVTKIVTPADLQKPPMQLLLYGLVSLVEMYLVKLIKEYLPDNAWIPYISLDRLKSAEKIFCLRKDMDAEIDLVDCLQICDKREIVKKHKPLFDLFHFESKNKFDSYLRALEDLRDHLAHAQEYMNIFTTEEIIALVEQTDDFLIQCEQAVEAIS